MAEKPLDGSTEKVHLPVASPPRNHGHTTAAWVTVIVVMAGAVVCSLAVMFAMPWLFWTGVGVVVLGLVAGRVLKMLGMGQPEPTSGRTTSRTQH
ncbi:HGxxPAAW family protein [Cellulomonas carbonis]|uniref:Uncharacterized protein n=1 Tax=Cellulomonas carbonis T26 TaxID=947969 RepID=A0A0A0BND1_9CELL|nr:HGxxPAAW family protein [Cellulomonas carbonis]KGM10008.1 hypothetical protein N868_17380 [Cellulomonas carbonis T26]MDT0164378.1 HGxxPAAW family protein [Actinotalea sp. AC32]